MMCSSDLRWGAPSSFSIQIMFSISTLFSLEGRLSPSGYQLWRIRTNQYTPLTSTITLLYTLTAMLIRPTKVTKDEGRAILESVIEYSGKQEKLWYSVDKKYGRYLTTEKLDGFLVGVLPLAMQLGDDITVKGAVSEKLYHNLTNYYMNIIRLAIPSLKPIKIIPDSIDDGKQYNCEGAVGTGFTAGIDSFSTVLQYLLAEDVLPNYRITHFIFNNIGSHGDEKTPARARAVFNSRYELIRGLPEELGIDLIKVDSNLNEFYSEFYTETYQSRHLSCPLLLQKLFSKYYLSSDFRYQDSFIGPTDDIAHTNPSAVHLLSTETLEFISSGSQYSRIEKMKQLAAKNVMNHWLNVCVAHQGDGRNCSICYKCCRTLLTLELLGVIDNFGEVFDLYKWKKVRNRYIIIDVLSNKSKDDDAFTQEIREYAADIGYSFPAWQRALGQTIRFMPKPLYNLVIRLFKPVWHKLFYS